MARYTSDFSTAILKRFHPENRASRQWMKSRPRDLGRLRTAATVDVSIERILANGSAHQDIRGVVLDRTARLLKMRVSSIGPMSEKTATIFWIVISLAGHIQCNATDL